MYVEPCELSMNCVNATQNIATMSDELTVS